MLFLPLHNAIYDKLSEVAEDGTYDQLKPVNELLAHYTKDDIIYSIDLSAATDRLPIEIQGEILTLLGLPGADWIKIVRRPYSYKGSLYNYAVGQPMGMYSSFAMLALTHHVIVRAAMLNALRKYSPDCYAILGDDIVIANTAVATQYKIIMAQLGVDINPIKGFVGKVIEFAKRIFILTEKGPLDVSPLSPKVLKRASEHPEFLPTLITDYINKGFEAILNIELSTIPKVLDKTFNKKELTQIQWILSVLGPQSGLWNVNVWKGDQAKVIALEAFLISILPNWTSLEFFKITKYFVNDFVRSSNTVPSFISNAWRDFFIITRYLSYPYIWGEKRFENDEYLPSQETAAALTAASIWLVILPLLIWRLLLSIFKEIPPYLAKIVNNESPGPFGESSITRAFTIRGNPTHPIWRVVNYLFPICDQNGNPVTIGIGSHFLRTLVLRNDLHANDVSVIFKLLQFAIPVQILNLRFQREERSKEDQLPAVKAAKRCLGTLSPAFSLKYKFERAERPLNTRGKLNKFFAQKRKKVKVISSGKRK